MEFEGIITMMGIEEEVGANKLRKITFVLEEESDREYKSSIAIDAYGEKVDLVKNFKQGDKVKVGLNFRAREYNGRWYNGISAWKIDGIGTATASTPNPSAPADDDLPF
ncbi:MAG TPA: DUF3127 domain-containing protein [Candidatus Absconditabacterales bacterium]|nr:DUF3127 domain-containing protein [Candidatus Absconditabacterales bacterium]